VSDRYLLTLSLVVVLVLASRYVLPFLPLRRWAAAMTVPDAALYAVGVAGLATHCGAMFFRSTVRGLPGGGQVIRAVDPMGTPSILWFSVAAGLVMIGLRRQHGLALITAGASLATVGYTMYDGGRLATHLTAIFVAAAGGLRIFWAWIAPGGRTRAQALAEDARALSTVAVGLVLVLFVSGVIEGFVTPAPWPWPVKIGIGAVALLGFLTYMLVLGRRATRAGETGDLVEFEAGATRIYAA